MAYNELGKIDISKFVPIIVHWLDDHQHLLTFNDQLVNIQSVFNQRSYNLNNQD